MNIADLFDEDTIVVGTPEVAQLLQISESDARTWAAAAGVARLGNSFAWARSDVEQIAEELDADEGDLAENPAEIGQDDGENDEDDSDEDENDEDENDEDDSDEDENDEDDSDEDDSDEGE